MAVGETLGVVIPCYNEGTWIQRSVEALHTAAERADWPLDVLVVDDGSGPETAAIIDELVEQGRARVLRQANAGRLAARLNGLLTLRTEHVFLLDARVIVAPDALVPLRRHLTEDPGSAWNAHVEVRSEGNPYAAFMYGITKVGWRRYFRRPRVVRFGPDEFDAYPKGTGAFVTRRQTLVDASETFDSLFADQRFASDDTKMLRNVAAVTPIGIDPAFSVDYYGRDSAGRWLKQIYFRGTTFVDGYVGTRGRALALLAGLGLLVPAGLALVVRKPALGVAVVGAGTAAAGAATRACGGTPREAGAVAALLVPFTAVFGAGFIRGLVMAVTR